MNKILGVILRLFRGMNWSDDVRYVKYNGGVLDALNTRTTSDGERTGLSRENILGNEYVGIQPEEVVAQNRRFKINIQSSEDAVYSYTVKDANSKILFTTDGVFNTVGDIAQTYADIAAEITSKATTANQTVVFISFTDNGDDTGYFVLEITTVASWDYTITQDEWCPDVVVNGNFATASDWTYAGGGAQWNITGGVLQRNASASNVDASQAITLLSNYEIRVQAITSGATTGTVTVYTGGVDPGNLAFVASTNDSYDVISKRTSGGFDSIVIRASDTYDGNVDDVKLQLKNYLSEIEIIQENIDASMFDEWKYIGSFDLLGDLYVWLATETEEPQEFTIANITQGNPGVVNIETDDPHNLTSGEIVIVQGSTTANTNGTFVATVIDTTNIELQGSTYTADELLSDAILKTKTRAIGEIGVYQKNKSTKTWNYTRLLRSIELNFRTPWQIDVDMERNAYKDSAYYADDNNPDRHFYYKGAYVTDGAIASVNPNGYYSYGNIHEGTKLLLAQAGVRLNFLRQYDAGGSVAPGNHKYTVNLLTESLTSTEYLDPIGPIPVFDQPISPPHEIYGSEPQDLTSSKINELQVTGIPANLYKWVELVDLWYSGNSGVPIPTIVSRTLIPTGATSVTIRHTGLENNVRDITLTELGQRQTPFITSRNIRILDNRLIRSKLKSLASKDFTEWFKTFEHSIERQDLIGIGSAPTNSSGTTISDTIALGEYLKPENVNAYGGFMMFETYRFYGKVEYKEGGFSEPFWIDDIRIDTLAYNIDAAYSDNRRNGNNLTNYDLTDATQGGRIYVPYISFHGFDLNYQIGGIAVKDLIKAIHIEMVEVRREVLSSGMMIMGTSGDWSVPGVPGIFYGYSGADNIGEFMFPQGTHANAGAGAYQAIDYTTINAISGGDVSPERRYGFFYSPDILSGQTIIQRQVGDKIISLGSPEKSLEYRLAYGVYDSYYAEFNGRTGLSGDLYAGLAVDESTILADGVTGTLAGTSVSKELLISHANAGVPDYPHSERLYNLGTPVFYFASDLNDNNGLANADYGAYLSYYYRPLSIYDQFYDPDTSKYGNRLTSNSFPINAIAEVEDLSDTVAAGEFNVFGKDVFTQKTFVRIRNEVEQLSGSVPTEARDQAALGFYSQNIINSNLTFRNDSTSEAWGYPNVSLAVWLLDRVRMTLPYNFGYNYSNGVISNRPFDPTIDRATEFWALITYSDKKLDGSLTDEYRVNRVFNIKYLDGRNGPINHHEIVNGELFTLQSRAWERQYFNSNGILVTSEGSEAVLGDGEALSRRGQRLSSVGTKHKWSVVKGKAPGGSDVLYWVNTELGCMMRFGYDGTLNLSLLKDMDAYFQGRCNLVDAHDTPANGTGICGVWNDQHKEAIITVMAKKSVQAYDINTTYNEGDEVYYEPDGFLTFEQTGEIFISKQNGNLGHLPELTDTDYWEIVPHTNLDYYNEFSVVFSEIRNDFTSRVSFKPKIYLKWEKGFLSPSPVNNEARLYEHNRGDYCVWYVTQEEDGFAEVVVNVDPENNKSYLGLQVSSTTTPDRVDLKTPTHESFLLSSDFEARDGKYCAGIKEDSTGTGINNGDTSMLFGDYMRIKIWYASRVYQSVMSIIALITGRPRDYHKR